MKLIDAVVSESQGFRYGEPQRLNEQSLTVILPIIRQTSLARNYVTFPECPDKVLVFDTGRIDVMEADNQTDQNVFMRSGTLFKGATQERALQRSVFLFPKEKSNLSVRCVHAHRGINSGSKVSYGGVTPLHFDQKVYTENYTPAAQSKYWKSVEETTEMYAKLTGKAPQAHGKGQSASGNLRRRASAGGPIGSAGGSHHESEITYGAPIMSSSVSGTSGSDFVGFAETHDAFFAGSTPGSDDLASHLDDFSTNFDDLLSKLERSENQVGIGLITQAGVETIEFFDHQASWKALHESAIKRIGSHVVSKADPSVFEYKPEMAKKQINKILQLDWDTKTIWKHQPSNGEPHVKLTGLSADGFVGEAMEVNRSLIHLVILKRAA